MATPLIPLLGYGLGPIPIPALPLALGGINPTGALGTLMLLIVAVSLCWKVRSSLT